MMIALHKNARTTPTIRAEIAASNASAASLIQHSECVNRFAATAGINLFPAVEATEAGGKLVSRHQPSVGGGRAWPC